MEYSISTVAYDGYDFDTIFDNISSLGVNKVEICLIVGSVADLAEADLTVDFAEKLYLKLQQRELSCTSFACHFALEQDADELLLKRLAMAKALRTNRVICYGTRDPSIEHYLSTIPKSLQYALEHGLRILVENPADMQPHVVNDCIDIEEFLTKVDRRVIGVNYDPGNFVSHRPYDDIVANSLAALDHCEHMHIKDVQRSESHYHFCQIGEGVCGYDYVLPKAAERALMCSIEAPLRLAKGLDGTGLPSHEKVELNIINSKLKASIEFIETHTAVRYNKAV